MAKSARYYRCVQEVKNAGSGLDEDELMALGDVMNKRSTQLLKAKAGSTAHEAVAKAVEEQKEDALTKAALQKRGQYKFAQTIAKAKANIMEHWRDDPRFGYKAFLVGANTLREGAGRSIDAQQKAKAAEMMLGFASDIERTGKWKLFASGALDKDTYRALDELYKKNPNMEGIDKEARQFAEIIYKWAETKRTSLNKAGTWIGRSADYVTGQSHDMFKVRRALYEVNHGDSTFADRTMRGQAWKDFYNAADEPNLKAYWDFTRPLLDEEKTYKGVDEESNEEFEKRTWRNIASGDHLKTVEGSLGYKPQGNLANKLSKQRILHFADGESRYAYDEKFGRGNSLMERFTDQLYHTGHDIVLLDKMGPNPERFHEEMKTFVRLMTEDTAAARRIENWRKSEAILDNNFDQVTGKWQIPGQSPVSSALRAGRMVHVLSKLGMMVPSSLSDLAAMHTEMGYQGIRGMQAWEEQARSLVMGYGSRGEVRADRFRRASEWGVTIDLLKGGVYSKWSAADAMPGTMSRIQHIFMKMNAGLWWTDTRRLAMAAATSHHLGLLADRAYNALPKETLRLFKLYGVKEDEWNLMRDRSVEIAEGRPMFSPAKAAALTDAEIASLLEAEKLKPTPTRIAERRDEIKSKFQTLIAMRAQQGYMHTSAKGQDFLTGGRIGIKPGTAASELTKSVMQFKSFPTAVIEKVFGSQIFGYGPELGWGPAMANSWKNGGMGRLAGFIAYATFLGYLGLQIKAYLSGRTLNAPRNRDDFTRQLIASGVQGGGLGIYGDFLWGHAKDRFGHSGFEDLLGPVAGDAADLYRLIHGSGVETPSGQDTALRADKRGAHETAQMFQMVRTRAPFMNLYWTKMAFDYLIMYRLMEDFSPGSLQRMEKAMRNEMNITYRLPPSSHYRAENFTGEDLKRLLSPTGQ